MMWSNLKALSIAILLTAVIEQPQPIEGAKLDIQYMDVRQAPFAPIDATVTGITTTQVEAKIGTNIWSDRTYRITSISDELLGASLFQPTHYVNRETISITSDQDAEIFIALYILEANREGGLMKVLPANGWTLRDGWHLTFGNRGLEKVWSKSIKAGETISFTSTKSSMTFAILIKGVTTTTSTTTAPTTTTTTVDTSEVICQDTNALCKMEPAFLLDILCQIETVSQQCPKRCNICSELETTEAPITSTTTPEPIEYEYLGKRPRKCKNAENKHTLTCKLSDEYKDLESKYPGPKCKAACDSAASCLAIGTHYHCDRLFFSDYETALTEVPADMCKSWEYKNAADNQIFCQDIDSNDCGSVEATNGCFVKMVKTE